MAWNREQKTRRGLLVPFFDISNGLSLSQLVVTTWYSIRKVWKDDFYT